MSSQRIFRSLFDKSFRPNRVQHLVVSDSKHLYFREKDEVIDHQKKELDPRTCGARKMLTRVIAVDEDTGVFYAELRPRDDPLDLIGFLGRAWAKKPRHPMRGIPDVICAPSIVLRSDEWSEQLRQMALLGNARVEPTASGFGPAATSAREYERQLLSSIYQSKEYGLFTLAVAIMAAPEISALSSSYSTAQFGKAWEKLDGLSDEAMKRIDACYQPVGAWRSGYFSGIFENHKD